MISDNLRDLIETIIDTDDLKCVLFKRGLTPSETRELNDNWDSLLCYRGPKDPAFKYVT